MTQNTLEKPQFWKRYCSDVKSIAVLVMVCGVIALATNLLNGLGYGWNLLFSFCYGFPISMIETYLRIKPRPPSEWKINFFSVVSGSVVGTIVVYTHLITTGIIQLGDFSWALILNFAFGFGISAVAFYFFWFRYRNQSLTLALRNQQLRASELEVLKQQAENRLLQSQMEPHFMFNTLATIQSLIDVDSKLAQSMVGDLSLMLRASLTNSSQDFCKVKQEMALVRSYMNIQKIRIGDRLTFVETIDEIAMERMVLPMIIQPILENSIKHGVETSVGDCALHLSILAKTDNFEIVVSDNCVGGSASTSSHGISLNNIRKRLSNAYGSDAVISSVERDVGWQTTIVIPNAQVKDKI